MSSKARFPGKSQNKNVNKVRLSYKETVPVNDCESALVAATANRLKKFRSIFPSDPQNEGIASEFIGFQLDDPLQANLLRTGERLKKELHGLTQESHTSNGSINGLEGNTTMQNGTSLHKPDKQVAINHVAANGDAKCTKSENSSSAVKPVSMSSPVSKRKSTKELQVSLQTATRLTRPSRVKTPNKKFSSDNTHQHELSSSRKSRNDTLEDAETELKSQKVSKIANANNHIPDKQQIARRKLEIKIVPIKNILSSSPPTITNSRKNQPKKLNHNADKNRGVGVPKEDTGKKSNQNNSMNSDDEGTENKIDLEEENLYINRPELVGACIMQLEENSPTTNGAKRTNGIIVCGICQKIRQYRFYTNNYKLGVFLCDRCYDQSAKLIKKLNKNKRYSCLSDMGLCLSRQDLIAEGNCCEACFSKRCLQIMDVTDDVYYKIWCLIPANVRNPLSATPKNTFDEYPNRGTVVHLNKSGKVTLTNALRSKSVRKIVAPVVRSNSGNNLSNTPDSNSGNNLSKTPDSNRGNNISSTPDVEIPEIGVTDRQVKRLLPNDNLNFKRVKCARVKQVCRRSGIPPSLPVATFKDLSALPSTSTGFLRSGKFSLSNEDEMVDPEANEEMLFGRQKGPMRERIKTLVPLDLDLVEEFGFPVVVTGFFPPKPLCFLCGSAGIEQLIFCTVCCEPYHPFCAGDDALMSYVIKTIPSQKSENWKDKTCEKISSLHITEEKSVDISNSSLPSSPMLSPPTTSRPFQSDDEEAEVNVDSDDCMSVDEELRQHVLAWTCRRCVICKGCGSNRNDKATSRVNEFTNCVQCRDPYHLTCVPKKAASSKGGGLTFTCVKCCKCRSCGKNLEGSKQSHNVNVSENDDDDESWSSRKNNLLLCLECFKRRQNGSYCPACQVCYDDNDYVTKMMECAKCERWIHAICESITDEQYQILGMLPESIEYICKVCDNKKDNAWRRAVIMDSINGCERILRIFQKNAICSPRKSKSLSFDASSYTKMDEELNAPSHSLTDTLEKQEDQILKTPTKNELIIPIFNSPSPATPSVPYSTSPLNLKVCKIVLGDIRQSSPPTKECRVLLTDILKHPKQESIKALIQSDTSLVAEPVVEINPCDIVEKPPSPKLLDLVKSPVKLLTPSKRVTSFVDDAKIFANYETFKSIQHFRKVAIFSLQKHFKDEVDVSKVNTVRKILDDAIEEVFPWLELETVDNLEDESFRAIESALYFHPSKNQVDSNLTSENKQISISPVSNTQPFQDVYWQKNDILDERVCSFCEQKGDFPPDTCGRILWAGTNEWVHTNCTLWSSEVWEQEDGALQQVGAALSRSKHLKCVYCKKKGASVSCCQSSCHDSFHFACAIKSKCALLENKTVFCPSHISHAKGDVQHEMQVMRKVFVDAEWLRKKGCDSWSSDVKVAIGSLRIDQLGYVVPISVAATLEDSSEILAPLQFKCFRLYWSQSDPLDKILYTFSTTIDQAPIVSHIFQLDNRDEDLHITVDHSGSSESIEKKLKHINEFREWIDEAPRYYDEYNIEWIPPCPFNFNDEDDFNLDDLYFYSQKLRFESPCSTNKFITGQGDENKATRCIDDGSADIKDVTAPTLCPKKYVQKQDTLRKRDVQIAKRSSESLLTTPVGRCTRSSARNNLTKNDYVIPQVDGGFDTSSESPSESCISSDGQKVMKSNEEIASITKELSGRSLRSGMKLPGELHKCRRCEKEFLFKTSMNRHKRFCKSEERPHDCVNYNFIPTTRRRLTDSSTNVLSEEKIKVVEHSDQSFSKKIETIRTRSSSKSNELNNRRTIKHQNLEVQNAKHVNVSNNENSEKALLKQAIRSFEKEEDEIVNEKSVRCENCGVTCRSLASHEKHKTLCVAYGNSTTEDDSDDGSVFSVESRKANLYNISNQNISEETCVGKNTPIKNYAAEVHERGTQNEDVQISPKENNPRLDTIKEILSTVASSDNVEVEVPAKKSRLRRFPKVATPEQRIRTRSATIAHSIHQPSVTMIDVPKTEELLGAIESHAESKISIQSPTRVLLQKKLPSPIPHRTPVTEFPRQHQVDTPDSHYTTRKTRFGKKQEHAYRCDAKGQFIRSEDQSKVETQSQRVLRESANIQQHHLGMSLDSSVQSPNTETMLIDSHPVQIATFQCPSQSSQLKQPSLPDCHNFIDADGQLLNVQVPSTSLQQYHSQFQQQGPLLPVQQPQLQQPEQHLSFNQRQQCDTSQGLRQKVVLKQPHLPVQQNSTISLQQPPQKPKRQSSMHPDEHDVPLQLQQPLQEQMDVHPPSEVSHLPYQIQIHPIGPQPIAVRPVIHEESLYYVLHEGIEVPSIRKSSSLKPKVQLTKKVNNEIIAVDSPQSKTNYQDNHCSDDSSAKKLVSHPKFLGLPDVSSVNAMSNHAPSATLNTAVNCNLNSKVIYPSQSTSEILMEVNFVGDSNSSSKIQDEKVDISHCDSSVAMINTQVSLQNQKGGEFYSGKNGPSTIRSLKCKGKLPDGERVAVHPWVHAEPTPDHASDRECNVSVDDDQTIKSSRSNAGNDTNRLRMTHRAVIVYEVKCEEIVLQRSSDVDAVWNHIFDNVQGTRLKHHLPPLANSPTNFSVTEKRGVPTGFNMLGLTHWAVQFLLEQLPGVKSAKNQFQFHSPSSSSNDEDGPNPLNKSGCARAEGYTGRKPFDMFGWLASKHRMLPSTVQNLEEDKALGLPIAMRFRNLKEKSNAILTVYWSGIHGRGLYARRNIEKGEMIIEYAGEVIRSIACDLREKYYISKGIGCYMFRINQKFVVDATMKGNAARFINHSCEPNCESKAVKILGNMHILIFALRRINGGEELTYDYKFNYEDDKIPCTCASKRCRKYLN